MYDYNDEVYWNDQGLETHGNHALMPLIIADIFPCCDDEYGDRYLLEGEDENGCPLTFVADASQFEYVEYNYND